MGDFRSDLPLGTDDPQVFFANVGNVDEAVTTRESETWVDRKGVTRQTWYGMEEAFQEFLINSGYENIGDYGPGLNVTARNQIFWKDGELYRASGALALPYTTTGDWLTEESLFVAVGDQDLRQSLANDTSGSLGPGMIGLGLNTDYDPGTVGSAMTGISVSSVSALLSRRDADQITLNLQSYYPGWASTSTGPVGGGLFIWSPTTPKSMHDGGTIISPTVPWDGGYGTLGDFLAGAGESDPSGSGCYVRQGVTDSINPLWFGAVGQGDAFVDTDDAAFRKCAADGRNIVVDKVSDDGYFMRECFQITASVIGTGGYPKLSLRKTFDYSPGGSNPVNDGRGQNFRWFDHHTEAEITGMHLVGDFDGVVGTETEHAHNVSISASSYKKVHNNILEGAYGDGVYAGKHAWDNPAPSVNICNQIDVFNNRILRMRRCAMAFVSGTNMRFYDNVASKLNSFVGLLDVEPNLGDDSTINGVDIFDNDLRSEGRTIVFYAPTNPQIKNVRVRNNRLQSGSVAIDISSQDNTRHLENIEFTGNWTPGLAVTKMTHFIISRCNIINLVMRGNMDRDSGRWILQNQTGGAVFDENVLSAVNNLSDEQGIVLRDSSNYTVSRNRFYALSREIMWGCINIVKTQAANLRVGNVQINDNYATNSRHFVSVVNSSGTTDPASFVWENSSVIGNHIDVTGNVINTSGISTIVRLRLEPNRIVNGGMSSGLSYTRDGIRNSITAAPDYGGQIAVNPSGVVYIGRDNVNWQQIS